MPKRRETPHVKSLMQEIRHSVSDAEKAIAAGNCGEAAMSLTHAYQLFGEAEGYARAKRELKGRPGRGTSVLVDKRLPALYRTKSKLYRACSR